MVKAVDIGNGVFLALPWSAAFFYAIVFIVPTSRPQATAQPPSSWSSQSHGSSGTLDIVNTIDFKIESNAVSVDILEFQISIGTNNQTSSGWKKSLVMPDGQGSQWEVIADGRGSSAPNALWAHQVKNGQILTFRKAKFLGIMTDVLQLGDLHNLAGGSHVTFRRVKDQ